MGECNHEMPGLLYPAFRRVNANEGTASRPPTTEGLADIAGHGSKILDYSLMA
jgi:hypothetical protein